jgi:hypothetical protein
MLRTSLRNLSAKVVVGVVAVTMLLGAGRAIAAPLLWNKLGSADEVTHSAYGPNLGFYGGGGYPEQIGNPGYVPGVFGNALTLAPGGYNSQDRVRNVVWSGVDQSLNSDRGTIEIWFKQNANPVAFSHGVYRVFDGAYGMGAGVGIWSDVSNNALNFAVGFGGTDVAVQTNVSALNGQWTHLAGVWDRAGIGGSADRLRLYVNGSVAASSTTSGWGSIVGQFADIGGGNDDQIAGKFAVDNLQVYDTALTDFSHRFNESGMIPEPAGLALLGAAMLPLLRRGRRQFR